MIRIGTPPSFQLIAALFLPGMLLFAGAAKKAPKAAVNARQAAAKPAQAQTEGVLVAKQPALALTYRLLKKVGSNTTQVDESEIFHSGDLIRLRALANQDAYLYVGLRASQGTWDLLLPDPNIKGGDNLVRKDAALDVPLNREDWFEFDDQPGAEHLFLVLSRGPVKDIEELIRTRPPTGGSPEGPADREKPYLALNPSISNHVWETLKSKTRGMKRVTIAEDRPPEARQESTAYIETREPGSIIVIEIVLKHRK